MTQNDTSPSLELIIERVNVVTGASVAVDITGATVHCRIKDLQTGLYTNDGHTECNMVTPLNGEVRYDFQVGDIPSAGSYRVDVETIFANGRKETQPDELIIHARGEVS